MRNILLLAFVLLISCQQKTELSSQEIIDKAIETAGGNSFDKTEICFDFRGKQYISTRNKWKFQLERITIDSVRTTRDVLNNTGFKRFINDSLINLPDSLSFRYKNSVNSVHYFAYLPYGLHDKAVKNKLMGEVSINGKNYYKIEVTFTEAGGGADHEDVYLYWIEKEKFTMDYLAYKFQVNDGGMRFRDAYNERNVNGIRFADYDNYKPKNKSVDFYTLDKLFEENQLEKVSKVELQNIVVKPCTDC